MDKLFVIAAGGTGAKVVEALIHLCSAGLGPEEVHVLLVDGDTTNGNRLRAEQTADCYNAIQPWPWRVNGTLNNGNRTFSLFQSRIILYSLAKRFDGINEVGLLPQLLGDNTLVQAMSVLLDEDELSDDLSHGFTGRPNLGSLVMDQHLRTHFAKPPQTDAPAPGRPSARKFIEALMEAARMTDSRPRVVVTGSVFGGTGASLLPVAKQCVKAAFAEEQATAALFDKLGWAKIMLLPFFRPQPGTGMVKVVPERHLMDTSSALWYYGLFDVPAPPTRENNGSGQPKLDVTYLIGSESPNDRKTTGYDGGAQQRNPPFFHEIIAALAVLDFYRNPDVVEGHSARHLGNRAVKEESALKKLPHPFGMEREEFLQRLGALFHLASFIQLATNNPEEYRLGAFQYSRSARLTGWEEWLHTMLIQQRLKPNDPADPSHHALLYFARLLLWAHPTLSLAEFKASGLEFDERVTYVSLHNTLCKVETAETNPGDAAQARHEDHFVARLCRATTAGLLREHSGYRGHEMGQAVSLVENNTLIRVGLGRYWVPLCLRHFGVMEDAAILDLCHEYGVNLPQEIRSHFP